MKNGKTLFVLIVLLFALCLTTCDDIVSSEDFIVQNTATLSLKAIPYTNDTTPASGTDGVYCLPTGVTTLSIPLDNPGDLSDLKVTYSGSNVQSAVIINGVLVITLSSATDTDVYVKVTGKGGRPVLERTIAIAAGVNFNTDLTGLSSGDGIGSNIIDPVSVSPGVTDYTRSATYSSPTILVTATAGNNIIATVVVKGLLDSQTGLGGVTNGSISLVNGLNPISIIITAPHGVNSSTYKLNVTAVLSGSTVSTLSAFSVNSVPVPVTILGPGNSDGSLTSPYTWAYSGATISLSQGTISVPISATKTDSTSISSWAVGVSPSSWADFTLNASITFTTAGNNQEIWVRVIAQAGGANVTYYRVTLDVAASANSTISSPAVASVTFDSPTGAGTTSTNSITYTATSTPLPNATSSVTLSFTKGDSQSIVAYNVGGTSGTYGSTFTGTSQTLTLGTSDVGNVSIWLRVTAQAGSPNITYYKVVIHRRPGQPTLNDTYTAGTGTISNISWSTVTGVTSSDGYELYHSLTAATINHTTTASQTFGNVTTGSITGTLAEGARYVYVRAKVGSVVGDWSTAQIFYVGVAFTNSMLTDDVATHYIAPGTYTITGTPTALNSGTKTLIPVGAVTINRGSSYTGVLFNVTGGTLNLSATSTSLPVAGATLTIDGGATSGVTAQHAAIVVNGGICNLFKGVTIQNNNNTFGSGGNFGGGINVSAGDLNLVEGSKVLNNKGYNGGGIYVSSLGGIASVFTISGASTIISGNTATNRGGGLYLVGTTTKVNWSGGTVSGNPSTDPSLDKYPGVFVNTTVTEDPTVPVTLIN